MANTQVEALKLALEALEEYTSVVTSVNDPNTWIKVADGGKPAREAITAIKAALEAKDEPVAWAFFFEDGEASNELFDTREQGEKWLLSDDCLWAGSLKPLYTTPPQRKPQTDEEIEDALKLKSCDGYRAIVRAIEAAHGIKE